MTADFDFPAWPGTFADAYRAKGYWAGETLGGMLRRVAKMFPDHVAVSEGAARLTYAELDSRADRIANGMAEIGLAAGDRVVVQLPNSIKFLETIFGLFRLGALPVFALPSDRISEITHIFNTASAKGYVIQDHALGFDYTKIAKQVSGMVPSLRHVMVVGDAGDFIPFESLYGSTEHRPDRDPGEAALVMLSGGSTALPKLIVRTHDDYLYSFVASAEICDLSSSSVYLCVLPAGHNFTLSSPGILGVLSAGGHVVMAADASGSAAFYAIEREQVTFTAIVPGLALAWLHAPRTHDLESLRFIQVGGAKLSSEVAQRLMQEFGCQLQQVYGMSEGLVCYTRLDDPVETIIGTQGLPISRDDEILIVDEDGQRTNPDVAGQLLVRGPYTIRGYLNAPEHNARSFTEDGFYKTGDLVRRRPDGYLVVEGRLKDQVNRGGEKIAAEEVESHLLAHPGVREAAVVAVSDQFLGEASCAFVVPQPNNPPIKEIDIKTFIGSRGLASFKVPDLVRFVSSLPKTTVGKIDKKALRKQLSDVQG